MFAFQTNMSTFRIYQKFIILVLFSYMYNIVN